MNCQNTHKKKYLKMSVLNFLPSMQSVTDSIFYDPPECCGLTIGNSPASILYKSIVGCYRPVSYADGPDNGPL